MAKPILVILAAGMGSRYGGGGQKQIDPMGPNGELIIDYSLFDARRAGIDRAVFVIKKENESAFREAIGDRIAGVMDVDYAFQSLDDIPEGFSVPDGRAKPWGTAHAVYAARKLVHSSFIVVNADDYYGVNAYKMLCSELDSGGRDYAMVGYELANTVTGNGGVSRGVCVTENGFLKTITERKGIVVTADGSISYPGDNGESVPLARDTTVSLNFWGFRESYFDACGEYFNDFLGNLKDPLKSEFYLPDIPGRLVREGKNRVKVLRSPDTWYGVTYHEDRPTVVEAFRKMCDAGLYPKLR